MKELTHLRTESAKIFDLEDGTCKLVSRVLPMHYKDGNDEWKDISTDILDGKVDRCCYSVGMLENKVGYTGTAPDGKKIELELLNVTYKEPVTSGNRITWEEIEPDVDFYLEFLPQKINAKRVLKTPSANKSSVYRSIQEEGGTGELLNLGLDSEGRSTKLAITEEETGNTDEKEITQVFDNKVMKMNPTTRKREWSDEVTYPVVIDPTFTVGTAANDRFASVFNSAAPALAPANIGYMSLINNSKSAPNWFEARAGLRFPITGLPQGSTISSATLNIYGGVMPTASFLMSYPAWTGNGSSVKTTAASFTAKIFGVDAAAPAMNVTNVFSPSTTVGTAPTPQTTFDQLGWKQYAVDVASIVAALVSKYDYTNAPMMVHAKHTTKNASYTKAFMYDLQAGPSKDAELVIVFTAPTPGIVNVNLINNICVSNGTSDFARSGSSGTIASGYNCSEDETADNWD